MRLFLTGLLDMVGMMRLYLIEPGGSAMTKTVDLWEMLEQDAPSGCEAVQDLLSWSLNYEPGKGPFTLFLDLIGWSFDEYGDALYTLTEASLGYVELGKLAEALTEYADRPHDVTAYVAALTAAGMGS